ncbi:MAG: trigger factor [Anaerolineae bacterium]|nr:trigger factor [Anaerolineae bacterium]
MLTIEKDILPDGQARLTVTIEPERLQKELQAAATRISKKVNIPGFRKGKAPYHVIARYFGDDAILKEAIEPLGQAIYAEAVQESGLTPYAVGTVEDVTTAPFVMTFTVPLAPEVNLGAYRDIRIPFVEIDVTPQDIEQVIEDMQGRQAIVEPVERPIEWGDMATLDIVGTLVAKVSKKAKSAEAENEESEPERAFVDRTGVQILVEKKNEFPVPGFAEKLIGMAANEERSFDISISAKAKDVDEELRGKKYHFEVRCHEIHAREVPPLDDEFARSVGNYNDLADLQEKVYQALERKAEERERAQYLDAIFKQMTSSVSEVRFPPVMLEEQIDGMIRELGERLQSQGLKMSDYLKLNNLTEESLRDDFRASAREQLIRALLVGKVREAEDIGVSQEEVNDAIQAHLSSLGSPDAATRQLFSSPKVKDKFVQMRLVDKTFDRLIEIARGDAPPLGSDVSKEDVNVAHEVADVTLKEVSDAVPTDIAAE